jgi:hypothetical protein
MVQNVELTFPKAESHLVEQTGLDTWCGNRGGDGSCTEAGFDRSADRLVRWQLQADAQRARVSVMLLELSFELITTAIDGRDVVICELAPLLLYLSGQLPPIALNTIPIHQSLLAGHRKEGCHIFANSR